ncbi:uncharacterized protein EI90DRAFT_3290868 [Cantharellus anzutake]|uniref:uncharacterized protein n=1 Tax=Cantharellus anzutake TaxID=1750568 RepID=UPI001903F686|nr:uncharacterized protein EI90DRAFT_3290868 [Cantharellus anzutake]KAF8327794.1 hypothetical protein EI90DRAFT_3290868 [Cantharellus anzutake]
MTPLEHIYGVIWLAQYSTLFGIITIQTYLYFRRFKPDPLLIKGTVAFLILLQAFQTGCSLYVIRARIICNFGVPILRSDWASAIHQTITVTCAAIVQMYYACRFYRLSRSTWLSILVVILTLAQFGVAFAARLKSSLFHQIPQAVVPTRPLILSWLLLEAVVDILIAASMWHFLSKQKTGFRGTDSAIATLSAYAINTGAVTAILALIIMFAFAFYGYHFAYMVLVLPLGAVYVVSLLANLHSRSTIRQRLEATNRMGIHSVHFSRLPEMRRRVSHAAKGKAPATASGVDGTTARGQVQAGLQPL